MIYGHLMRIAHRAVLMVFLQTMSAMDRLRSKMHDAVARQQATALIKHKGLKGLATLELPKDIRKARPESLGIHGVEDGTQLRVGRDVLDTIDGAQIAIFDPVLKRK